jgi:hypothetical protein
MSAKVIVLDIVYIRIFVAEDDGLGGLNDVIAEPASGRSIKSVRERLF